METHCLRQTQIPGTTRLYQDYLYNFDRLTCFYSHAPYDPASFAAAASKIRYPESRRSDLINALRKSNPDSPALDRFARQGTVAVVTGQQVGLFSGPAYTIYKALTAARLAEELTARGMDAVPVFWLATEDHDFAEVNHAHVFTADHRAVSLRAPGDGVSHQPVGGIRLPDPPVNELARALEGFPSGSEIAAMVREAYPPGAAMGTSFRALLSRLLARFNVIFLDPLEPAIREIAAPFLAEALAAAPGLNRKLRERSVELEKAGYHAQVLVEENASLLFRIDGQRRLALKLDDLPGAAPSTLSPNALLRPVFQDYLLPTVAYVGGGAEIAYFAQSQVVYRELLGSMPVIVPRSGFTIVDAHSVRAMNRFGMHVPEFFAPAETVRERIANRLVPPSIAGHYADSRKAQEGLLASLRAETLAFDPSLAEAIDKSKAKIEYQFAKMECKIARETLRRNARASADSESLLSLLYPEKHLQERYYSILPFLAEQGLSFLDDLYANVHFDCPDHKILQACDRDIQTLPDSVI